MQSIEEFMSEFFLARTLEIKKDLEGRAAFRQRFFVADCDWDSREGELEQSESEVVKSVSASGVGAQVITCVGAPLLELRYQLQASDQSWLIRDVEFRCPKCQYSDPRRAGKMGCAICGGKGWIGSREEPPDGPVQGDPFIPPTRS
jgi:hypothetical protein